MPSSSAQNSPEPHGLLYILSVLGVLWIFSKLFAPFQKPIHSISPNAKAADENDSGSVLSPLVAQGTPTPPTTIQTCQCCHHKAPRWKVVLDWLTGISTTGAFIAASIYAGIAAHQLRTMNSTYGQIQQQTKLMRQQLIGTQAGILKIETPRWNKMEWKFNIILSNYGPSKVQILRSDVHIARKSISKGTYVGEPIPLTINPQTLPGFIQGRGAGVSKEWPVPWPMPSGTFNDSHRWPGDQVVVVEGSITYNNSFEDGSESFCYFWLPGYTVKGISEWTPGGLFEGGEACRIADEIKTVQRLEEIAKEEIRTGKRYQP